MNKVKLITHFVKWIKYKLINTNLLKKNYLWATYEKIYLICQKDAG